MNENNNELVVGINGTYLTGLQNIKFTVDRDLEWEGIKRKVSLIIIKNGVKLSDSITNLPYGIVDKRITGIGGTTLELMADRNSIIVEPLKSIASSKAATNLHEYKYVGSAIGQFKDVTIEEIVKYHQSNIKFKKLLVVADSLPKVVKALGEELFSNYFIVLDEVDSFQSDSTFRDSMDSCLDYYKRFPEKSRCMITATMQSFTDPDLSNESYTIFDYDKPTSRNITTIKTTTIKATVVHEIAKKFTFNEKVVIAYNSIDDVLDIIVMLKKKLQISDKDIALMCSKSSKKKAGIYYREFDGFNLSTTITFLTSAYFTGIDLNESYHSIAVSNSKLKFTLLSDNKLKQIAGRCRPGLLSETIIYSTLLTQVDKISFEQLLYQAKRIISSLNCFDSQYESDLIVKSKLESLQSIIIDNSGHNGYKLVRKDINGERAISFFNIDAFLESQRVNNTLYREDEQLNNLLLKQKHLVNSITVDFPMEESLTSDEKLSEVIKELLRLEAIAELQDLPSNSRKDIEDLLYHSESAIKSRIIQQYLDLYEIVDRDQLIEKISDLSKSRDLKEFNNFKFAAEFLALDESNPLKSRVMQKFKLGDIVTNNEVQIELNKIYAQLGLMKNAFSTPNSAWKTFTSMFQTKWKRKIGEIGPKKWEIIGLNPDKIQLIGSTNSYNFLRKS